MTHNVGTIDRLIRLFAGLLLLMFGAVASGWWAVAALIPLGTGLSGRCPLYTAVGVSTCSSDRRPA